MSDITIRPDDIGTPDVSIKVNVAGGMDGVGIENITITGGAETDDDGPGGGSGGITHETDPTVPAWAKQPEKPTYTADEVGAASQAQVDTLSKEVESLKNSSSAGGLSVDAEGNATIGGSFTVDEEGNAMI